MGGTVFESDRPQNLTGVVDGECAERSGGGSQILNYAMAQQEHAPGPAAKDFTRGIDRNAFTITSGAEDPVEGTR